MRKVSRILLCVLLAVVLIAALGWVAIKAGWWGGYWKEELAEGRVDLVEFFGAGFLIVFFPLVLGWPALLIAIILYGAWCWVDLFR